MRNLKRERRIGMKNLYEGSYFIRGLFVCTAAMFVGLFVISSKDALEIWDKFGMATIIAVIIATCGVMKQIEHSRIMQQREIAKEIYGLCHALAGEIKGLIIRTESMGYTEHFKYQYSLALAHEKNGQIFQIGSFYATNNYTSIFDGNVDKIGLLGDLSGDVSSLYSHVKGTIETANGIANGIYKNEKQSDVASMMIKSIEELIQKGNITANNLLKFADEALIDFHSK